MKSVDILSSNSTDICKCSLLHVDGVVGEAQSVDKPGAQGDECNTSALLIFSCMSYQYNCRCYEFFLSLPTSTLPSSITPGYARGSPVSPDTRPRSWIRISTSISQIQMSISASVSSVPISSSTTKSLKRVRTCLR